MKAKTAVHKASHPHKPKPKLPKIALIEEELIPAETVVEPEPEPEPKPLPKCENAPYTMEDWQEEVRKHVLPGRPIPDWLLAKSP